MAEEDKNKAKKAKNVPSITDEELAELLNEYKQRKSKNKKKKKKKPKKTVQSVMNTTEAVTRWEIVSQGDMEVLTFFNDSTPILVVPFDEDNFSILYRKLQGRFSEDFTPDKWLLKEPSRKEREVTVLKKGKPKTDTIIEAVNPRLTFTRGNRVLSSIELNPKLLKSIHGALSAYVPPSRFSLHSLKEWWKHHKIKRVFLILLSLGVVVVSLLPTFI